MDLLPAMETLAVGFYNVGLAVQEINQWHWSRKQRRFKNGIVQAVTGQALDTLRLSALGSVHESLDRAFK